MKDILEVKEESNSFKEYNIVFIRYKYMDKEHLQHLKEIVIKQAAIDSQHIWNSYDDIKAELLEIGKDKKALLEYISSHEDIVGIEDNNMNAILEGQYPNYSDDPYFYKDLYYDNEGYQLYFKAFTEEVLKLME